MSGIAYLHLNPEKLMTNIDYVIYAEDDEDDRAMLAESFRKYIADKTLVTMPNGMALLHYLHENRAQKNLPCMIILDQNMPLMNGGEVIAALKIDSALQNIPVVLFTTTSPEIPIFGEHGIPVVLKPDSFIEWDRMAEMLLSRYSPASPVALPEGKSPKM